MRAIESLKSANEEEENVDLADESGEEMDNPDNETSTEMPEEAVVNGEQTSPTKCKPKGSPKRQKLVTGNDSPKSDIVEVNEIPAVQTNVVKGDSDLEIAKESNELQAPVAKCGKKAAGRAGEVVGAKTRGRKKAKVAVSEESGSPSSPLHVEVNEISPVQTNGVNGDSDLEIAKESNELPAPAAKRGKKAAGRAVEGIGSRTRGRKKINEAVSEENGSPSSPLHVNEDLE